MKTYSVHFTGRTSGAIGIFYTISDSFNAKNDRDFSEQFWDKYELGTTRTQQFFFDVQVDGKKHVLDTKVFAGGG